MFFIYKILANLVFLFSPLIILIRLIRRKEHPLRFKEKFSIHTKKKNSGKLLWFHGASVGEILSVVPLIKKLEKQKNIKQILVTSNTLSSSNILADFKLKKTIHQFFPIDSNYHSNKFLNHWKPSVAIFIDSEVWPNMLNNIKKRSISLILINARITNKSFKKWKMFRLFARNIFLKFDVCLSSNFESKNYLKSLGAKNIKYIGNLKFCQTENDKTHLNKKIKKFFVKKKIWCASSTHYNEEIVCAKSHKELKYKYKNLLTIIIPRHIHRSNIIKNEIQKLNLSVHMHSSKKKIDPKVDVYLVDTFGQTKSFFKICKNVFLGGSLIKHGGQNPLEAVRYGCNIIHGPNIWNFKEIYSLLKRYKVSNKIIYPSQLTAKIDKIINMKADSKNIENKIQKLGDTILNSTLKEVNYFIGR